MPDLIKVSLSWIKDKYKTLRRQRHNPSGEDDKMISLREIVEGLKTDDKGDSSLMIPPIIAVSEGGETSILARVRMFPKYYLQSISDINSYKNTNIFPMCFMISILY